MGLPEASVGLLPCAGGTQALAWLVGEGWAKRMILCGERITADTALRIGLVEQVVEQGQSRGHALLLASRVARQSPVAVRAIKPLINGARQRIPDTFAAAERKPSSSCSKPRTRLRASMPSWKARPTLAQPIIHGNPAGNEDPHEGHVRRSPGAARNADRHRHSGRPTATQRAESADDRSPARPVPSLGNRPRRGLYCCVAMARKPSAPVAMCASWRRHADPSPARYRRSPNASSPTSTV